MAAPQSMGKQEHYLFSQVSQTQGDSPMLKVYLHLLWNKKSMEISSGCCCTWRFFITELHFLPACAGFLQVLQFSPKDVEIYHFKSITLLKRS